MYHVPFAYQSISNPPSSAPWVSNPAGGHVARGAANPTATHAAANTNCTDVMLLGYMNSVGVM